MGCLPWCLINRCNQYQIQNINYLLCLGPGFCKNLRTVFSVLEATQSSIAKKIQMLCKNCKKRCPLYSVDLLKIEPKFRSEESFRFLSKARIINYSKKDFEFYMFIKNLRNNIHLVEIGQQISNYPYYDEKYVNLSVEFMGIALNIYKVNLEKHLNNLGCYRRQ